jgi:hypothetical protein
MQEELSSAIRMFMVAGLAIAMLLGNAEDGETASLKAGEGTISGSEPMDIPEMAGVPSSHSIPLPPKLTYCDAEPCASTAPLVVYVCPTSDPMCIPTRTTTIIPRVDGKAISGISLTILSPNGTSLRPVSGSGIVNHSVVWDLGSKIVLGSDQDVRISVYEVAPVWGGLTNLNFTSTLLSSTLLDTIFYRYTDYDTGTAAIDLHNQAQEIIKAERAMAGLTSKHITAFYFPPELNKDGRGGGNASYEDGTVGINYGSPSGIAHKGGIINGALPIFAHEYAHQLFDEIKSMFSDDYRCLNEGIADALAFSVGFIPEEILGPIASDRVNFDSDCSAVSEIHDVGNCYFWHVKKAGLLTPTFLFGIFHPQHTFSFNSCDQKAMTTGNSTLAYFTEAAGGANMVPVLNSMKVPHAGSYETAKGELGLRR